MSGHLGNVQRTAQNLEVVRVDAERNLLLIKGAVPGAKKAVSYKACVKSDAAAYFPPQAAAPEALRRPRR